MCGGSDVSFTPCRAVQCRQRSKDDIDGVGIGKMNEPDGADALDLDGDEAFARSFTTSRMVLPIAALQVRPACSGTPAASKATEEIIDDGINDEVWAALADPGVLSTDELMSGVSSSNSLRPAQDVLQPAFSRAQAEFTTTSNSNYLGVRGSAMGAPTTSNAPLRSLSNVLQSTVHGSTPGTPMISAPKHTVAPLTMIAIPSSIIATSTATGTRPRPRGGVDGVASLPLSAVVAASHPGGTHSSSVRQYGIDFEVAGAWTTACDTLGMERYFDCAFAPGASVVPDEASALLAHCNCARLLAAPQLSLAAVVQVRACIPETSLVCTNGKIAC